MRWIWIVLVASILAAGAVVSCARLFRPHILEDPEPTGTLCFARMHQADHEGERLGAACGVGDFDGDGRPDYAVGAPQAGQQPRVRGQVRIHSGATGDVLSTLEAPEGSAGFGESIALLPDLDGDGARDLAIGAPGWERDIPLPGEKVRLGVAEIRSGRSGKVLRTLHASPGDFQFGSELAGFQDPDDHHHFVLLVGVEQRDRDDVLTGAISAFSATDGMLEYRVEGTPENPIGARTVVCGDLDGDRCPDFAASGWGSVLLVSGRNGALLRILPRMFRAGAFPSVDGFDFDRDGCPDVIVGESVNDPMAHDGRLVVYSGRDGHPLWTQRYFAPEGAVVNVVDGAEESWLAVAGYDTLSFFSLPGTTPVRILKLENGCFPTVTLPGDVDGDGKPDLLLAGHGPRDWVGLVSSKDLAQVFGEK